ncbi:MAG: popeye domain-containing protein [Hyphomicrobiaceae bacterium]|nr:popeye domain-containing protein [Hyphomicrobiaceae bacterium]
MLGLDVLVSVANVIYLLSYSVRDILWLRVLTVVGALMLLPYYYLQPEPLWVPIAWNLVFTGINIFWITKLLLERRPVHLSDDEKRLYQLALRNLSPRDALKLFKLGTWTSAPAGTVLITQDEPVDELTLIVDGKVSVDRDGEEVDTLGEGRFLGATAFLNRSPDFTAPVTVIASEQTRVLVWPADKLEILFAREEDLEIAVEASLGLELSRFLETARAQILPRHIS